MSDGKKIRRLSRLQLLEIMYEQERKIKKLEENNNFLVDYIRKQNLEIREQKEIINLLSRLGKNPMGLNLQNTLTIKGNEELNQTERQIVIPPEVLREIPAMRENG